MYDSLHPCPACGKDSDLFGDHTSASEYERIHRHDTIRDAIFESAKYAVLSPIKEARVVANSQSRPGDIFVDNWRGKQTAFDVAVTSPLSQTALPQSHKTPISLTNTFALAKLTASLSFPWLSRHLVVGTLTPSSISVQSQNSPLPARLYKQKLQLANFSRDFPSFKEPMLD